MKSAHAWSGGDPDAVARAVLARPEFAVHAAAPPPPNLLAIAWQWFVDHLLRPLFRPIAHVLGAAVPAERFAGFVAIAAILILLGVVAYRLARSVRPARGRGTRATLVRSLDASPTPERWLDRARDAAANGDYRGAIVALYAAALAMLDDGGIVALDATRTPGEYRRLVRRSLARASDTFDDVCERFVRAAFSTDRPGAADYERTRERLRELEPLVRS